MTLNITIPERQTRQIRRSDADFMIPDGMMLVPRAMMLITKECPKRHYELLFNAIVNGWIETVAYVEKDDAQ